ncbi:MAG: DUF1538 domain-containing protein [Planctomycetota bacterium JB042]
MPSLSELFFVFLTTTRDVLPIAVILTVFQAFVLRRAPPDPRRLLLGFACVLAGLALFLLGLEHALFPLGKTMAAQLTERALPAEGAADPRDFGWLYAFAFAIGFATTVAEPSLIAVALKANELSGGAIGVLGLRVAVAIGVAVGITLGVFRIVVGAPLHHFIIVGYVVVVVQTFFAPRLIVPLAYDSGGVTTSTVSVPLIAALGLGLAMSVPGRSPLVDGFGLIAFASLFPIMSVMAYAQIAERRSRSGGRTEDRDREEAPGTPGGSP